MPREEDSDDDELICIFDGIKSISLSEVIVYTVCASIRECALINRFQKLAILYEY